MQLNIKLQIVKEIDNQGMHVGFHPSFNENVRGVPPTTPHSTRLFQMSNQPMTQKQSQQQVHSNVTQHPQAHNITSLQTPGRFNSNNGYD